MCGRLSWPPWAEIPQLATNWVRPVFSIPCDPSWICSRILGLLIVVDNDRPTSLVGAISSGASRKETGIVQYRARCLVGRRTIPKVEKRSRNSTSCAVPENDKTLECNRIILGKKWKKHLALGFFLVSTGQEYCCLWRRERTPSIERFDQFPQLAQQGTAR